MTTRKCAQDFCDKPAVKYRELCREHEPHTVPCSYCGRPTPYTGTKHCDPCHGATNAPIETLRKILAEHDKPNEWQPGVIEFHTPHNKRLWTRFFATVRDLRASASIMDLWLMDLAGVLRDNGYEMTIRRAPTPPAGPESDI